ncbi:MAG: T9SS type A sorting domain-containing protein [Flavobacteriales bacterium]|nr:T9SS type A sorting domain-containing protein [Flavobacteriales bacterium]
MKRFFGILMILVVATGTHANNLVNDSNSEPKVEIATRVENNFLSIEVADELVGTNMTVSVFNSMGEIVLEETLGLGLNKINVQTLAKGDYVAVVRENDQYASKSAFVVS